MKLVQVSSFLVLVHLLADPAVAGEASGQFKVEGRRPITPRHAAAYETRDQRDARQRAVEIVLTATPLDVARIAAELDPHTEAINEDALKDDNYVLLWVKPDGSVTMNATYSDSMMQFIDMTSQTLRAELTSNTADKIEGRVYTPKPVKTMGGEAYNVDLRFSTAVTRAGAGTKLPAGGGEPAAGFKSLTTAVEKKHWENIKAALVPEQVKGFEEDYRTPEENLAFTVDILKAWLPKKGIKVIGGELRGDKAVLEVEGEIFEGQKALYLVEMHKSGSKWLYARSVTAGFLD